MELCGNSEKTVLREAEFAMDACGIYCRRFLGWGANDQRGKVSLLQGGSAVD